MTCVIEHLLTDQPTGKSIVLNTSDYEPEFSADDEITVTLAQSFVPRSKKPKPVQKERTKHKGEVVTPIRIIDEMIDVLEDDWKDYTFDQYIDSTQLEICCGEAPFIVQRYDPETGESIDIENRNGLLDRKLKRIRDKVQCDSAGFIDKNEWFQLVIRAYKSTYGYELQGDSLYLGRKNLLDTFIDWHEYLFKEKPHWILVGGITEIISWNLVQMDGLKPDYSKFKDWLNEDV